MPSHPDLPPVSVLLIDGFHLDRAHWAEQLKRCSSDYEVIEGVDGKSGLDVCKARRIDCVVLELALPDRSGLEVLMTLVPRPSKPKIAVIILTHLRDRRVWELVKKNGAYACFYKDHITGADLNKAIQQAVALVGQLPKEDRYRPL